ncbi:MAG: beta-hydroxyacyl-ACP dehydratase [Lachnospiraceae bacterium]|nr:beta-hydroxyacyl-ACP dehydratase [Lachnospiraceae bacterium]
MNDDRSIDFDMVDIQKCQRNRYPLLFIDKVTVFPDGEKVRAEAVKNFTFNEWYMPAHFDDDPNVPGFVQTECLVQTFLMTFLYRDELRGKKTSFLDMNNVKFRRKLIPGDQLRIVAVLDSYRRGIARGHVESFVGEESAVSADYVVCVPDVMSQFRPTR